MFLARAPLAVRLFYPFALWHVRTRQRAVYLTFDDGPMPGPTEYVLQILANYNIRGTFFMVGENAQRYPHLVKTIRAAGHAIGGHTYNHLSGFKTRTPHYFNNITLCQQQLGTRLFRPPYGRMWPWQALLFRRRYPQQKIIMWSALSGDYDHNISPEQCIKNVLSVVRPGSIIVFHDSHKAFKNLETALPVVIAKLLEYGYTFRTLASLA